ncbi:S8 family peptidase [Paracoccus albus]|uniref:S8 family peptidase n=1 Tax=Paracoccus albus TaxID=3017784 RepID=UPI0022F0B02A|nr:S8 family peptidase [Paracoccus albus]WBU62208.1 S8 family peptidase [Paracoccus albus]
MPERPLLKLPEPTPFDPRPGPRGGGNLAKPQRDRQGARIGPRFERLMRVAGNPQDLIALQDDPASIAPERAIVFELAGQLKDFYTQAQELGLEYLGDYEEDIEPDEDFHDRDKPEKTIAGRIYLAMPDVRALQELLGLWRRYQHGEKMPTGKSQWRELFSLLVDVRPWAPQDRVLPEMIEYWRESLHYNPDAPVRFEIELWFHENGEQRNRAFARVEDEVHRMGGEIVHHATLPEIRYDAALVDIPPDQAQRLIEHPDIELARVDEIMFLRPQSVARFEQDAEPEGEDGAEDAAAALPAGNPIAALLDGLPIQNHIRLAGRIIVDDPDDLDANYPVNRRVHGTEMASLIVHGDLTAGEAPLENPLLVLPVMQPDGGNSEQTPPDRLLVDVIHRAVRRIKAGDGDEAATAPDVVLINLSLGDRWRPFARVMSPLGRLLDFLAHRYRVLFLVSAGNVLDRLVIPDYRTSREFEDADPEEREKAILAALNANKSQRTLYSPSESVNAVTIGAAHKSAIANGGLPANLIDPFTDERLPNIVSAMGLGYRKGVKPDLLFAGGRMPVRVVATGDSVTIAPADRPARLFGARAAAPDRVGGTRHEDFTCGTSVATALATRAAHRIYNVLMNGAEGSNHDDLPLNYRALALKALLAHGAEWGPKGAMLDDFFQPHGQGSHFARRDDIARLLGFGVPDIERVLDCTENRATLLGIGSVAADSALLYRIPIPGGLDGQRAFRALTATLAWFTPINARHQGYRRAALDISPGTDEKYWITDQRESYQPTDKAIVRGTLLHERRTGERAAVFVDNGELLLRISCRAVAGELNEEIPYALAISFEVGIEAGIPVYEDIRARIAPQVGIGVGG